MLNTPEKVEMPARNLMEFKPSKSNMFKLMTTEDMEQAIIWP